MAQKTQKTLKKTHAQNSDLNTKKRSELERQACPLAHPTQITRKSMLLARATAQITKKCQYYTRGVVDFFGFVVRLDEYCDFGS